MDGEEEGEEGKDGRRRRGMERRGEDGEKGKGWRERVRKGEERRGMEGERRSEEGRGGEGEKEVKEVSSEDSQRSSKISRCCTVVEALPEPTSPRGTASANGKGCCHPVARDHAEALKFALMCLRTLCQATQCEPMQYEREVGGFPVAAWERHVELTVHVL